MTHPLTEVTAIDTPVEPYLRDAGEVFQAFRYQDSGTISYGVLVDGERWFVKVSDDPDIVESFQRAVCGGKLQIQVRTSVFKSSWSERKPICKTSPSTLKTPAQSWSSVPTFGLEAS